MYKKEPTTTATFQTSPPLTATSAAVEFDVISAAMGAADPVVERVREEREDEEEENERNEEEEEDLEKGEVGVEEKVVGSNKSVEEDDHGHGYGLGPHGHGEREMGRDFQMPMMHRLNPTNPLRVVVNGGTRVAAPRMPTPPSQPAYQPRSTPAPAPTPQQSQITLNSRKYTNKISLFIFVLHMVLVVGLVCFLVFKGVQGLIMASDSVKKKEKRVLKYMLPQVEAAALLSITLAFTWQKAIRLWPRIMVHFIIWCSFLMSLAAGILLICFQKPPTDGVGVCFIAFAIGNGLYACWVNPRIEFCCKVLIKSLDPVSKFPDLNQPTYWSLGVGFVWMSIWILAVVGALNFYFPPLIIIALGLSLAWTTEVLRNIVNLTVSRVIALYYLRGMQSSTQFCFQRAMSINLGSACLGSLFVPTIEALRIIARALDLLRGEDEFLCCCAHCCLNVMQSIFRYGNGWAYVQIAAYGKSFVKASQETWELFKRQEMEPIVDADMTSAICFLTGACSGSICVIVVAAWTAKIYQPFTATISLLAFFVGYLMTRIAMALPHACVSCYYACYAENPDNRLFDTMIKDRLSMIKSGRDVVVPTPRVPRRFTA